MSDVADHRHYQNAPITEAVIDLRVELPPNIGLGELQNAHKGQETAYPRTGQANTAFGQMQAGKEVTTTATTKAMGYLFRSADDKQIYQARLDGFSMSRLAPYEQWETFRDEARRLWNLYTSAATPRKVVRVAVRYVNRLDIPLPLSDFGDYLRTVPEVSADLPQGLVGYFMRLAIPLVDINGLCVLNEAIVDPAAPSMVSIVLDIDVFRTSDVPTDEDGLWNLIEGLRVHKNVIFEACITDKARELFK